MTLKWSDEARIEITSILNHLQATAPDVARQFATRIARAAQNILAMPRAARFDPATDTYDRYVPHTRIILTYAIQDDFIEVVRVWHTSRDPETKL